MTVDDAAGERPTPGAGLLELMAVMARLRRECPWDAEQTHESLAPHLLEESYEALDALESGDPDAVREELGDVLLQVYFHAEVASERTDGTGYTIDDVAERDRGQADPQAPARVRRRQRLRRGRGQAELGRDQGGGARGQGAAPARCSTACRSGSPRSRSPPSCSGAPSGPAFRRPGRVRRPRRTAGLRPAGEPAALVDAASGRRRRGRPASSARSCSRSWPGPARPALTRSWSCAPPPAPTATASWPGRSRPASR